MTHIAHRTNFGTRDQRTRRGDTKTAMAHDWRSMGNNFDDAPAWKQTPPTNGHGAYFNVSCVGHKHLITELLSPRAVISWRSCPRRSEARTNTSVRCDCRHRALLIVRYDCANEWRGLASSHVQRTVTHPPSTLHPYLVGARNVDQRISETQVELIMQSQ